MKKQTYEHPMNYSKTTKRENSAKLLAATTFNQNFVFESETQLEMDRVRVENQG